MGENYTTPLAERMVSKMNSDICECAPKPVGVCSLTQQLNNDIIEILAMCKQIDLLINGPKPEDNSKKEGPSCLKEHMALNLSYTASIKEELFRILHGLED
jgi:hypothetical protein